MQRGIKKSIFKRSRKMVVTMALIAVILTVSTFAWFIGMRTVNVTSFDIDIATTDSLLLSLDGETWATEVTMNQDMIQQVSYEEHTNRWSKLIPMSTVGQMDVANSRLILYEKASYTATPGGARIMTGRVDNTGPTEADGYVAFDLFIKNFSGHQYIEQYNYYDEEAIYLTNDSEVVVSSAGIPNTGIENSARVAFSPIGRVNGATTDVKVITGIKCTPLDGDNKPTIVNGVTGICRTDRIWEPNENKHVINAIKWYNASCRARTGLDVTKKTSYSTEENSCGQIANDNYYPTYAIASSIPSSANVDIYDGATYNGYTNTVSSWDDYLADPSDALLVQYPYFTDADKIKKGKERPEFMRLAPASITKVRIYIYIEGQDVDNYDFSQIGKKISVRFGFTKQPLTPDDIGYDENGGPAIDSTLPVITILGNNPTYITQGTDYVDAGATAEDNTDGVLTEKIHVDSNVNKDVPGTYKVTYSVTDAAGNKAIKTRYVVVESE